MDKVILTGIEVKRPDVVSSIYQGVSGGDRPYNFSARRRG